MTDPSDAARQFMYAGPTERVGEFRFVYADNSWEWSATVAAIHGYDPSPKRVTTDVVLGHKHPEDRAEFDRAVQRTLADHGPFNSRHRIVDTHGKTHHVLVIGDSIHDDVGDVVGTTGVYVDLSAVRTDAVNTELDSRVSEFAASRAVIEQAKGMLMFAYHLTADQAFDLLSWRSQESNVKVRDLATAIVDRVPRDIDLIDSNRTRFDQLLMHPDRPLPPK
ncbi:PAS and ANTAR domain-containing protein [Williamsia deligens]|uniref:PAS and ANTAR domain-containing protein n=1 Tax=Williamsia deligens TaxID=321325 RepID=A0ABW3G5C9_9NOCA|nr:PAS and ANTAR domain-containing protein [Williamsia deligens]